MRFMQELQNPLHLTLPSPQGEGEAGARGDVLSHKYSLCKVQICE